MSAQTNPTIDEINAAHEAGHAVVAVAFNKPFASVSVIPDDSTGGRIDADIWMYTVALFDSRLQRRQLQDQALVNLAVLHGGHRGVSVLYGEAVATSGAGRDLEIAASIREFAWETDATRKRKDVRAYFAALYAVTYYSRGLKAVRNALLAQGQLTRDEVMVIFRRVESDREGRFRLNRSQHLT